jgi:lipopolysaccharide export system protein LptC
MAAATNFHSQLVGWLKILLPLAALMLLSTLFLFARSTGGPSEIPFAEIDAAAAEQRIAAPRFSGLTNTGDTLQISAEAARPDAAGGPQVTIDRPRLSLDATDGTSLRVTAGAGMVDTAARTAQLSGLARLETSSGYLMETKGLTADMTTGTITSDGALEVQAPFGQLQAGQVTFQAGTGDTGQQMNFTKGVKLVYTPSTAAPKDE